MQSKEYGAAASAQLPARASFIQIIEKHKKASYSQFQRKQI